MDDSLEDAVLSFDGSGFSVPDKGSDKVGIIFGKVGTTKFDCSAMGQLRKNDYVMASHETCGWVLGQVDQIERQTDLSIEKAQKIAAGEHVDINEKVKATISVIGFRDDQGLLKAPRTPFRAGNPIFHASDDLIRETVGLEDNPKTGAYIGLLGGHDIKVYLDINNLVNKHLAVLAKTGGGKSYVTGDIIEELMKHNITTVIIDPHGEYPAMKKAGKPPKGKRNFDVTPQSYTDKIQEFSTNTKLNKGSKPLKFTLANMDARGLLELTGIKNSRTLVTPLRRALDSLKSVKGNYSMKDIIRSLENEEDSALSALIAELDYLDDVGLFDREGTHINELVVKGKTTVINLRGTPPDIQGVIVNRLATALFELRKIEKIPPLMLITEECHNYCPQQGTVASSQIYRTIASEGRKFGLGLAVITQRPAKVDKNVLSQCNTLIILKVTNPNDLKAISNSVEGLTPGMTDDIQRLPIGTALITGGSLSTPLFVEVRPRETKHGGESIKVLEEEEEEK